jgi:hypothetical protein
MSGVASRALLLRRSALFRKVTAFAAAALIGLALRSSAIDILIIALVIMLALDFAAAAFRQCKRYRLGRAERSSIKGLSWRHGALLAILVGKALWFTVFWISPSTIAHGGTREDLISRRDYLLERVIRQPFGPSDSPIFFNEVMQEEWAIVTLSMLGAALTNLSFEFPETRVEHLQFVDALIKRMLAPDIRRFEQLWWNEDALDSLDGQNGHIGYLGHLNLLLQMHRILGGGMEHAELSRKISAALARRMSQSPSGYLETFPGQIFVPDNAAVVASLALSDSIERWSGRTEPYRAEVDSWLDVTRKKFLDSQTGLILPWVDAKGLPFGHPRGSYSTWNVFYLLQIDRSLAEDQSRRIRKEFVVEQLPGLCGVREYLADDRGLGDVDSGPVIFGLSTSGTGFGMAAARTLGDKELLACLLHTGELVGSSIDSGSGRRYLIAPLIGDAIVLAMRTAVPWDGRFLGASESDEP